MENHYQADHPQYKITLQTVLLFWFHCFMFFFSVSSYLWPLPNHTPGLGWVWSQFTVAQGSNLCWKAAVLKQTTTLQTLLAQSFIILLGEPHCMLFGANALLPVLLTGQSICCGCHPHLSIVQYLDSPDGGLGFPLLWAELSWFVSWSSTSWTPSRRVFVPASFIAATGDGKTGWDHRQGGASNGQLRQTEQTTATLCKTATRCSWNTNRGTPKVSTPLIWILSMSISGWQSIRHSVTIYIKKTSHKNKRKK